MSDTQLRLNKTEAEIRHYNSEMKKGVDELFFIERDTRANDAKVREIENEIIKQERLLNDTLEKKKELAERKERTMRSQAVIQKEILHFTQEQVRLQGVLSSERAQKQR